ncbi:S9 family peptidase [Anaeromonas frigoriresistens]|nr:S9 family peptidase [Anaeromonas frigoriresistens]
MEKLKLDNFIKYKFLSGVKHSPKGNWLGFVLHEMDKEENKYLSNIWICKDQQTYQLTSSDEDRSYLWLEDGENILFSSNRTLNDKEKAQEGEEFTQYYKININGGEARKYFNIDKRIESIKQIDEDRFIFTASFNSTTKNDKKDKDEKDYIVLDEIPFWSNGEGYTNKKRSRLYIYNKRTGETIEITDEYTDVEGFHLNSDKNKVVYISTNYKSKMDIDNDIFIYDIDKDNIDKVSSDEVFAYSYANFIAEDKLILLGSDMKRYGINENSKFYIIDINSKERKCITPEFERSTWNSVGSDCRYGSSANIIMEGEYLYFITTEEDSSYINRIDIDGTIEKLTSKKGSVDGFSVCDGEIFFIGMRNLKLQEIYKLENKEENQITKFNEWLHKEKNIASLEKYTIKNGHVDIDGWIMKPVDFEENKKYPAILDIHGGPKTVYGEVFYHEMQYWANQGYVVFFLNPRGSDGKGNEFADIRGKYGTIDYEDIMEFTKSVLDKYSFIDKTKVGVTGGSYGGFMTNWIIGHTDIFEAAVSQRSISNWISKFNTTDIGYYFVEDQNGATPWSDHEKLWWHSPLRYADKVKTPTLFIHSEEDYRCWVVEGIQMFTALKFHGVESRMCIFKEENHELSRSGKPKHRIRRLEEITEWFDKYLK